MKIEGSYFFNAPRKKVWDALLNPKVLAQCVPGCEDMKEIAPDHYEAILRPGPVGATQTYKGKIRFKDKRPPTHCVLSGAGSGAPGVVWGDVVIDLDESEGKTLLRYRTDARMRGRMAGIGQRMVGGLAKALVAQFFRKVEELV